MHKRLEFLVYPRRDNMQTRTGAMQQARLAQRDRTTTHDQAIAVRHADEQRQVVHSTPGRIESAASVGRRQGDVNSRSQRDFR